MTLDKIKYDFETGPEARNIPGRELEYFVYLLWTAKPEEIHKYARKLRSNGFHHSVLTLTAAESYFPFVSESEKQLMRVKKIAKRFSDMPHYWETSFTKSQDIKARKMK